MNIRKSETQDLDILVELYRDAFPDEDLIPLVRQLLADRPDVLSLVSHNDPEISGNIIFTFCEIRTSKEKVALLGPLAVDPVHQKKGIGSNLVREGIEQIAAMGVSRVFVLGDPNYYSRFGFIPERSIEPPYDIPQEWQDAWQSICNEDSAARPKSRLLVPEPWQSRSLWAF